MDRNDAEDLRRRQLVAATIDTIAEVGFGAATLALIGQRAGVSAGLIAHYFDDRTACSGDAPQPRGAALAADDGPAAGGAEARASGSAP
jgi:betaine-aldehyde dehydrogenase